MTNEKLNNLEKLKKHLDERLDILEKYTQMILIDHLMDHVNDEIENECQEELAEWMQEQELTHIKYDVFDGKTACFFAFEGRTGIKRIREIMEHMKKSYDIIPIAVFEKINKTQKNKMLAEGYSFWIPEREMHIFHA